ncbi:MAG TPA: hypothetical protein GXX46_06895 [Peptococcaceae bacterium]|nr:hypothetical protein [Peptococcaceae bacterium]
MENMYLDYYQYLLRISWPALCGLFLIYLFLGTRAFKLIKINYADKKPTFSRRLLVSLRLALTIIVLAIYTQMFVLSYGDWMEKPALAKGQVDSLEVRTGGRRDDYYLNVRCGEEKLTVRIDSGTYLKLKSGDQVEIVYLPRRKEVFWCIVLT